MDVILQDLKFALRTLGRSPGFAATALLTLALGIGANTAIFSVVNGVLLRPLPYEEPHELVALREVNERGGTMPLAHRNFVDWRDGSSSFSHIAVWSGGTATILGGDEPIRARVMNVSREFFPMMDVDPVLGRTLLAEEHRLGADPAVVVGHGFWQQVLGGRPDLQGVRLDVGGFSVRVVGVMPAGFDYPSSAQIWAPVELREQTEHRTAHNYSATARLAPDVSIDQAQAELAALVGRIMEEFPDNDAVSASVSGLQASLTRDMQRPLWLLMGAAGMVLLVACLNLAATLLARGSGRRTELSVRSALGAGKGRIVRQLFTESLLLASAGGALGLVLSSVMRGALLSMAPATVAATAGGVGLDPGALGFTALITLVTACAFGLVPALQVSEDELRAGLGEGARGNTRAGRQRAWGLLVAGEVAVALVLLVGSGLLVRSFWNVIQVDPGFDPRGRLTVAYNLPGSTYPLELNMEIFQNPDRYDPSALVAFYDDLLVRLEEIPGVEAAGLINSLPFAGRGGNGQFEIEGRPFEEGGYANYRVVNHAYFEAMGIPLLHGRLLDSAAQYGTPHEVVVNQELADRFYPGMAPEEVLGQRIRTGGMDVHYLEWTTIVGIVGNVRHNGFESAEGADYYLNVRQRPIRSATLVFRGPGGPGSMAGPVRQMFGELDDQIPTEFRAMEDRVRETTASRRFTIMILVTFAGLALLLAAVGVYGVVSYSVAQRTREMGIRIALGAEPAQVVRLVAGRALWVIGAGALVGVVASIALVRVVEALLVGVEGADPVTVGGVLLLVVGAGALASIIPARRAVRIDPITALRAE